MLEIEITYNEVVFFNPFFKCIMNDTFFQLIKLAKFFEKFKIKFKEFLLDILLQYYWYYDGWGSVSESYLWFHWIDFICCHYQTPVIITQL